MPFNTKLILPLALGLSIFTVTSFVVYYVFKKEEEDIKKNVRTSRVNTIEISVPKSIVPALIGRNGSNIKEIEKKSRARIHFKKFTDKDYDVCIIQGQAETTQVAETIIHEFIRDQPLLLDENMTVPAWSCGRIIGVGGETINDISHRSGARVKLEGGINDSNTTRTVTIRGTKQQIDVAKGLIENCVSQEKCRREIEQSKRTSRHVPSQLPSSSPTDKLKVDTTRLTQMPGDKNKHAVRKSEVSAPSIEVFVSAVSSPSRFWVQFVGPQVAQLDDLVEQMTEYYSNKDNREQHALSQVSVGQVVAAVFRHDGRWYRARVTDIRPNEFDSTQEVADVFYLDYGDSEYVAVHELCELRADLLRLRFQAMECFLAGVRPSGKEEEVIASSSGGNYEKWHPQAIERFEELTQVARWKPLISKTCTYKKTDMSESEKEREIPGIKLYESTSEGEIDVGATLIAEGWAVVAQTITSPRASPSRTAPFGDLGKSMILGISNDRIERSTSLPKTHDETNHTANGNGVPVNTTMSSSQSLASGLEKQKMPSDFLKHKFEKKVLTSEEFIAQEKEIENRALNKEDTRANMNRIDSHHASLEGLGRQH